MARPPVGRNETLLRRRGADGAVGASDSGASTAVSSAVGPGRGEGAAPSPWLAFVPPALPPPAAPVAPTEQVWPPRVPCCAPDAASAGGPSPLLARVRPSLACAAFGRDVNVPARRPVTSGGKTALPQPEKCKRLALHIAPTKCNASECSPELNGRHAVRLCCFGCGARAP